MRRRIWLMVLFLAGSFGFLDAGSAHAIPAFARREHLMCQDCHFRVPELKDDARHYIERGLREMPPEGQAMERMSGQGMTMSETVPIAETERSLGQPLPLQWADYLTVMGHHMFNARRGERAEFDAGEIDIWAAGPINRHWSGLANPSFDIEEGGSDVDQGYGQFITAWREKFGSARFGQILPFAILFHQGGPGLPLSSPAVLSTPGDTGSPWTPDTLLRGVEIGAVDIPRWNVYFGAAQPRLEDAPTDDRHTDVYASAKYQFGRDDKTVSLDGYGYLGKVSLFPGDHGQGFHRAGAFVNVRHLDTQAQAGYLQGSDDLPGGRSLDNSGYFVLVERILSDRWAAYGRYDHFRRDLNAGGTETVRGPVIGVSFWAASEVILTAEGQLLDSSGKPEDRILQTQFLWVF